ncbi:cofilin [Naegleria gruberi]|uniref:Cofilin n=1 Tax=Naegleria gruberi TaxID=5762 RepID=D2VBR4_NAEGR|nr:cofilin [Naegleria gruberi]EFC45842.1 cofilin [Naegleria gruberi]|eukprot:XP_002678586.1 cofilin [Naegleria gruberi]
MVDAGVVVDDNCIEQFKAFHQKSSNVRLIVFSINEVGDKVEVAKQVEKGGDCDTWETLCTNLLGTEYAEKSCWVVYNLEMTKEDQGVERQISKLIFLHWVPSKTKLKFKMLMSSTKQTLFTKLGCSMVNIEGTHLSDISEKNILDKLKSSI